MRLLIKKGCKKIKSMKYLALFIVVVYSSVIIPDTQNSRCSYYLEKEKEVNCIKSKYNYLIGYGSKYCNKFIQLERLKDSDSDLKKWIGNTLICLQEMIQDNKKRIQPSCKQLESFAFDTHPICYKQYNICSLSIDNKWKIVRNVEITDYFSSKSLIQAINVGLSCLSESPKDSTNRVLRFFSKYKTSKNWKVKRSIINILHNSPNTYNRVRDYFSWVHTYLINNFTPNQFQSFVNLTEKRGVSFLTTDYSQVISHDKSPIQVMSDNELMKKLNLIEKVVGHFNLKLYNKQWHDITVNNL